MSRYDTNGNISVGYEETRALSHKSNLSRRPNEQENLRARLS